MLLLSAIILLIFSLLIFLIAWLFYKTKKFKAEKNKIDIELHDEQCKFQTIFDRSLHSIAIIHLNGRILKANKVFCDLFGYGENEILALNYFYMINHVDRDNLQANIQHLLDNFINIYQSEHECYTKNSESIWVISTLSLVRDSSGKEKCFIVQIENITSQKSAENRLHNLAYHDALTGLANRNKLEHFVKNLLANASRQQQSFALLILDLDGFKGINDTMGHDAGDVLLQIVAERLRNCVRITDTVARLGGDEFVIVITQLTRTDAAATIAQKILENISQIIIIKEQDIHVTTSIGISVYPDDGDTLEGLMKCADMGLYRSKEKGRNNYQYYTQEMTLQAKEKIEIKNALGRALAHNEFYLHYQPKMDIHSRCVTGVEALLRWNNQSYIGIRPDRIIALAEESGLIIPVSEWILKTASEQLKKWHKMGFSSLTMAVNCTSRQFKQATFIHDIKNIVTEVNILPQFMEIEITEKMIMNDTDATLNVLESLKAFGFKIVIDDFGTGYWSIGNLRKLTVDKIKIDRTFIKKIPEEQTSDEITSAIIAMLNKLGLTSIAEGVETKEQYQFLEREGCQEIQGYYLSPPISADEMTEFLKEPTPKGERGLVNVTE